MRPALLRLLKRPSALSIIDFLISSSPGIEHLQSQLHSKCLRCHSSSPQPLNPQFLESRHLQKGEYSETSGRSLSFPVHPIQSSPAKSERDDSAVELHNGGTTRWKELGLQPERLDYESDIGHTQDIGTRLVDDPAHRSDFGLWLELLRYRQRRYGHNGTLHIWEGLMRRVGGLQLPVDGEGADTFWQSFVDAGFDREIILNELVDYALQLWNQTDKRWPRLYQSIVGRFVKRGMADQAVKWHKRLQKPHLSSPNDISHCFTSVLSDYVESERAPGGLRAQVSAFRGICKHTDGHQIYGQVIPALIRRGKFQELLRMHYFLIQQGDSPRSFEEFQPLLEFADIFRGDATKKKLWRSYTGGALPSKSINPSVPPTMHQSQGLDIRDGSEGDRFDDSFGARIFATKAFNFEMILAGLKTFRVPAIGPQSLREMARRARGSTDVQEKLDRLEQSNISVGNSVFSRLLRRFATENRETLLFDLVHSDQHHEVLEDPETQASLLMSHYAACDWRQYNLTLIVLKELLGDGLDLLSIHVRKHIAAGETALAAKVVTDMLIRGFTLNDDTITFMVNYLLDPRKPGRRPVRQSNLRSTKDLAFAFRYLQNIAERRANVPLKLWNELLKRYGMADRWDELRTCCLWLARRYSAESLRPTAAAEAPGGDQLILQKIFDRRMQEAIVAWGFIIEPPSRLRLKSYHATGIRGEQLVPFARGIILLRELQKRGVDVRSASVRRVCRQRLMTLYGRPILSNRPRNRALREENPHTAEQVIADINSAWGEPPLFDEEGKRSLDWMFQHYHPYIPPRRHQRQKDGDRSKI
ncbi:hypothetical protein BDW62DRAFT_172331 [Aspergillus aurantiobrunneus]